MDFVDMIWLWTLLSVIGAIMNARLNKWCFVVYIISNIGWIAVNIQVGLYEQIPLWVVYIIIGLHGWYKWSTNEINTNNSNKLEQKA